MTHVYAVIAGREYQGEIFDTLRIFLLQSDAENYASELQSQGGSEVYTRINYMIVDTGPADDMLNIPSDWDPIGQEYPGMPKIGEHMPM